MFRSINQIIQRKKHKNVKCHHLSEAYNYCSRNEKDCLHEIPPSSVHLNELQPGEKATIVCLLGCSRFHNRLQEMGFVAGKQIQVIRFAPIGDPMEIDILGTKLSLRKAEAASILVTRIIVE